MWDWLFELLAYLLGDILTETRAGRILLGLAVLVGCGMAIYGVIRLING